MSTDAASGWLVAVVAAFLGLSLLLYAVLGGADFGAGMLECFLGSRKREKQQVLITEALGPVWEANHMWLVLAVVILFNGFPRAFAQLCISFHVPLTAMLLGIVLRGCAFTFRHYDVPSRQDRASRSRSAYTAAFAASSVLTPFMLGVIAGGMMLGRVADTGGYVARFVTPWATGFSAALGVFVCALFAFLAAVYLIGETHDPELQILFARRARIANGISVLAGLLVFAAAQAEGLPLLARFVAEPFSLECMILATVLLAPLWFALLHGYVGWASALAADQVSLVLLGWFALQYPVLIAGPEPVTLANAAAPAATLRDLLGALIVGSALVFPALYYLLRVFKLKTPRARRSARSRRAAG
jgi:cytochrome d ubiquinol oxidase subunit II